MSRSLVVSRTVFLICLFPGGLSLGCGRVGYTVQDELGADGGTMGALMDAGAPRTIDGGPFADADRDGGSESTDSGDGRRLEPTDAGGVDAGPVDSGTTDSGTRDSGAASPDAGPGAIQPTCLDGIRNGDEEDVDCGGTACAGCGSGCPNSLAGALFCDGMESIPGGWSYDGGAAPETSTVHSGAGSARYVASSSDGLDLGLTEIPSPPVAGSVFFRGYYYLASGGSYSRLLIMSSGASDLPTAGQFERVGILLEPDRYAVFNGMSDETYISSPSSPPRDRWFCVQLEVSVATTDGEIRLSVDGQTVLERDSITTRPVDGFDFLNVGTPAVEGLSGSVTVYVDDVAFGTAPIDC